MLLHVRLHNTHDALTDLAPDGSVRTQEGFAWSSARRPSLAAVARRGNAEGILIARGTGDDATSFADRATGRLSPVVFAPDSPPTICGGPSAPDRTTAELQAPSLGETRVEVAVEVELAAGAPPCVRAVRTMDYDTASAGVAGADAAVLSSEPRLLDLRAEAGALVGRAIMRDDTIRPLRCEVAAPPTD